MQFDGETNGLDIASDIDFWAGSDDTSYPTAAKVRNSNLALERVFGLILQADGRWKFDDINNTGEPTGTFNLVANQNYVEVTGATYLKISKVLILESDGKYHVLTPISEHSREAIALLEKSNSGTPKRYMKKGENIYLDPYPGSALTSGLKVFAQKNVHPFAVADTTAEPGFAAPFHRLISLHAAKDYCAANDFQARLANIKVEIKELEAALIAFYSSRDNDDQPRIRTRKEDYGAGDLGHGGINQRSVDWE